MVIRSWFYMVVLY